MDVIDILGEMLKRKTGGSGKGGGGPDILRDILTGGKKAEPPRRKEQGVEAPPTPEELHRTARELEDFLKQAHQRGPAGPASPSPAPRQAPPGGSAPREVPQSVPQSRPPADNPFAAPRGDRSAAPGGSNSQTDQARVLVRAMLNAAKADGAISSDEQQNILRQFGSAPQEIMQFLREEVQRPLDVREFAWSVPMGMEQQVYAMSLLAIDADSRAELDYLRDLAHGLRLPAEAVEQLMRRYAPGLGR